MMNKVGNQSSGSNILLVKSARQARDVVSNIKETAEKDPTKEIVLGLDCEGLHVNKALSLLQVSFDSFKC